MLANTGSNVSQVRTWGLVAVIVAVFFLLSQTFDVGPREIEPITRQSIQVITNNFAPSAWRHRPAHVTKVTAMFGHENELYEAAIRSHDEHNRRNKYEMKVLRERIVNNFWSKPAYLLSLIVEELAKPAEERTEWLMWLGPDIIVLNSRIPLDIFLPPEDSSHIHFIGTHDAEGFNSGAFFLKVHEWSVQLLIEVLAMPRNNPALESAGDKDRLAMEMVLTNADWRKHVVYQPRTWFNAYQLSATEFEGKRGDLLVHFHDLEGDKWSAMSSTLAQISQRNSTWSVPLGLTTYTDEIREYWLRRAQAEKLLEVAERRISDDSVADASNRLTYAFHFEADSETVMNNAMDGMKSALGMGNPEQEHVV